MIFNLYRRVVVKVGDDERHVYDRSRLMYTEVAEIEKVTGLSYPEWERELFQFSMKGVAPLLHVLRKRDGQPSDFATMQFNVADLSVAPLREDGTEFTLEEMNEDLDKRIRDAKGEADAGPTLAVAAAAADSEATSGASTPGSSPSGSGSVPGSGTGSPGRTSRRARPTSIAS